MSLFSLLVIIGVVGFFFLLGLGVSVTGISSFVYGISHANFTYILLGMIFTIWGIALTKLSLYFLGRK